MAVLLDEVEAYVSRFVAYPSEAARVAHVLWIAHTHVVECFENTPRLAFLSPEPGSGKTRALEITEGLVPRPVLTVSVSPAYVFRKISDEAGLPTLLIDEADAIFNPRRVDGNEDLRALLNSGYRRGATAGRAVVRGKEVFTEDLPSFAPVALAGLGDLPDTIMTRSVVVRMKRRRPGERVEPYRRRVEEPAANVLYMKLADWADTIRGRVLDAWPELPAGIEDRDADVWEPLITVADAAGSQWPNRARNAAVALLAEAHDRPVTLGIRLLADLKKVFGDDDRLATTTVLERLHDLEDAPWANLKGEPIDARFLARTLHKYEIPSAKLLKIDGWPVRGYDRSMLWDAWERYVSPSPGNSVTAVTPVTGREIAGESVTAVTENSVTGVTQEARKHAEVTAVTEVTEIRDKAETVHTCPIHGAHLSGARCEECAREAGAA